MSDPKRNVMEIPRNAIGIVLHQDRAQVNIEGVTKNVDHLTLRDVISQNIQSAQGGQVSTSIVPFQIPTGTFVFGREGNRIEMATYNPGANQKVGFHNGGSRPSEYEIPFPNVVITFVLELKNGKWVVDTSRTVFMCTHLSASQMPNKIPVVDPSAGFHPLALPNMHSNNLPCYGSASINTAYDNDLRGLHSFFRFLVDVPFNCDLSIPGAHINSPREWMNFLRDEAKAGRGFPYKHLNNCTLR